MSFPSLVLLTFRESCPHQKRFVTARHCVMMTGIVPHKTKHDDYDRLLTYGKLLALNGS